MSARPEALGERVFTEHPFFVRDLVTTEVHAHVTAAYVRLPCHLVCQNPQLPQKHSLHQQKLCPVI